MAAVRARRASDAESRLFEIARGATSIERALDQVVEACLVQSVLGPPTDLASLAGRLDVALGVLTELQCQCGELQARPFSPCMKSSKNSDAGATAHLPAEAAEALLELATGGKPRVPPRAGAAANPFHHPDAQRWASASSSNRSPGNLLVLTSVAGPARCASTRGTGHQRRPFAILCLTGSGAAGRAFLCRRPCRRVW